MAAQPDYNDTESSELPTLKSGGHHGIRNLAKIVNCRWAHGRKFEGFCKVTLVFLRAVLVFSKSNLPRLTNAQDGDGSNSLHQDGDLLAQQAQLVPGVVSFSKMLVRNF